ncbi:MAG: zf-TFIIB domain-containing protein [Gemmatimonadales bacterium]
MSEKPSRNEEEYFARQEAERLQKLRQSAEKERVSAAREAHYMKCPKCGADLAHEDLHGIEVDRCLDCQGVWLDHGETERLLATRDAGGVGKIFQSLFRGVKAKPADGP